MDAPWLNGSRELSEAFNPSTSQTFGATTCYCFFDIPASVRLGTSEQGAKGNCQGDSSLVRVDQFIACGQHVLWSPTCPLPLPLWRAWERWLVGRHTCWFLLHQPGGCTRIRQLIGLAWVCPRVLHCQDKSQEKQEDLPISPPPPPPPGPRPPRPCPSGHLSWVLPPSLSCVVGVTEVLTYSREFTIKRNSASLPGISESHILKQVSLPSLHRLLMNIGTQLGDLPQKVIKAMDGVVPDSEELWLS